MNTKTFTAVIHKEENLYVAQCLEVGTVSQGENVEEAITNIKEVTELYLEEFPLPEITLPITQLLGNKRINPARKVSNYCPLSSIHT